MTPIHNILPADALLLLGPTGSGKSPLGDRIAASGLLGRRALHLDFGSELRAVAAGGAAAGAYAADEIDFIRGVLERGLLLENEHFALAGKIIRLFLERNGFAHGQLLVLNGIPRHAGQARDMAGYARILAVVRLDCSDDDVRCRLESNTGGDRSGRNDDHRELVRRKLETFSVRTAPLVDLYRAAGARIYCLPVGSGTTALQKYAALSALAAADPPVALVAEPPER